MEIKRWGGLILVIRGFGGQWGKRSAASMGSSGVGSMLASCYKAVQNGSHSSQLGSDGNVCFLFVPAWRFILKRTWFSEFLHLAVLTPHSSRGGSPSTSSRLSSWAPVVQVPLGSSYFVTRDSTIFFFFSRVQGNCPRDSVSSFGKQANCNKWY